MGTNPEELESRVRRFVGAIELLPPGVILLAVSGGQDSVCMLDLLSRLGPEQGIQLQVAHLDHMFRGAESEADGEFVRGMASRLGLPAILGAIDVPAYAARHRLSNPVAARYARYRFLAAAAQAVGATRVAVAHTADDAAETLLMNLLRGSGLAGLRGIVPARPLAAGQLGPSLQMGDWRTEPLPLSETDLPMVVRPLLPLFRAETEAYCRAFDLPFRSDPSNLNTTYRRNWIRQRLLPILEEQYPGAKGSLWNAAELLADDHELLAALVEESWSRVARETAGRVEFGLDEWRQLGLAMQRHLLRRAVEAVAGGLEGLERVHLESAVLVIREGAVGARIELPGHVWLGKGYESFWLSRPGPSPKGVAHPQEPTIVQVPGITYLPNATLETSLLDATGESVCPEGYCTGDPWEACLDADVTGDELVVRYRRPGDRFVPLGMGGTKKLHDFMVDEKIPRHARDGILLIATPREIVWVAGHRIDDRFKVTPQTRRILRLRLGTNRAEDAIM